MVLEVLSSEFEAIVIQCNQPHYSSIYLDLLVNLTLYPVGVEVRLMLIVRPRCR